MPGPDLGHAWDPRAAEIILDRVGLDHPDDTVRFEVARALPGGFGPRDACWQHVVAALITLSDDHSAGVRDWACFGLGQLKRLPPRLGMRSRCG